ncbi:hypothetical protein [Persicobacter psychrovividus]|uniref:DUF4249 family protein n=1 Tax=Persicobacter psychrovividus TaxID=387638 RepID=A0ABM7VG93_9BACT|nr:hypothetical protein PEPS_22690 [Persicobacter psychrovividus]
MRYLLIISCLLFTACQQVEESDFSIMTLQTYLYPNQKANLQFAYYDYYDSLPQFPSNINPSLRVDGEDYALIHLDSGHFQSVNTLPANEASVFEVVALDGSLTSTATMPEALGSVALIDSTELYKDQFHTFMEARAYQRATALQIYVEKASGQYYYYQMKRPEEGEYIYDEDYWASDVDLPCGVSASDSLFIDGAYLEKLGEYELVVASCSDEFVRYFQGGINTGSIDPNYSNISGGVGVFTAMNPDTLVFSLKRNTDSESL